METCMNVGPDASGDMEADKWFSSTAGILLAQPVPATPELGPTLWLSPKSTGTPAKLVFDLPVEQLHSCPAKSCVWASSAYWYASPWFGQLWNEPQPPDYSPLCCYSKCVSHLVTIHRIKQHNQDELLWTWFISPLRFREEKTPQFSRVRFVF